MRVKKGQRKEKKKLFFLRTLFVLGELNVHHDLIGIVHKGKVYRFCLRHAMYGDVKLTTDKTCGDLTKVAPLAMLFALLTFELCIPMKEFIKEVFVVFDVCHLHDAFSVSTGDEKAIRTVDRAISGFWERLKHVFEQINQGMAKLIPRLKMTKKLLRVLLNVMIQEVFSSI